MLAMHLTFNSFSPLPRASRVILKTTPVNIPATGLYLIIIKFYTKREHLKNHLKKGGFQRGFMATPAGFEPAISTVTGWHVRPLHHGALKINEGLHCFDSPIRKFIRDSSGCQVEFSLPVKLYREVLRVFPTGMKANEWICYNSGYAHIGNRVIL
jgi:hypothetical protein